MDDFDGSEEEFSGEEQIDFSNYGVVEEPAEGADSQPEAVAVTSEEEAEYPPFWKPVFDQLPKEFHNLLTPELKKWDQNYTTGIQKVRKEYEDKYAPYKQFEDANISVDSLMSAYLTGQRINQDPLGVLEDLKKLLIESGQLQEAEDLQEKIDDLGESDDPLVIKTRELEAKQQQVENFVRAQYEQQQAAQIEQQNQRIQAEAVQSIESEFAALEAKVGPLSPFAKQKIAETTAILGERNGRPATIEAGYRDFEQTIRFARGNNPGARAPRLMPSGGGHPAPQPVDLRNEETRIAAIERIAREAQGN